MSARASFFTRNVASNDTTAQERRYLMALSEQMDILSGNVATSDNAYNDGIEKLVSLLRSNDKITADNLQNITGQFAEQLNDVAEIEYTLGLIGSGVSGETADASFDLQATILLAEQYTSVLIRTDDPELRKKILANIRRGEWVYPEMWANLDLVLGFGTPG